MKNFKEEIKKAFAEEFKNEEELSLEAEERVTFEQISEVFGKRIINSMKIPKWARQSGFFSIWAEVCKKTPCTHENSFELKPYRKTTHTMHFHNENKVCYCNDCGKTFGLKERTLIEECECDIDMSPK